MKGFGLVSLLIALAVAAWWITNLGPLSSAEVIDENGEVVESTSHEEVVGSALDAVELIEK
jgi:hypothetical protein